MKRTVYIIDDNPFVREALVMLIEDEPDLEVCGFAGTAFESMDNILAIQPDVVLTDLSMPGMGGIELITHLVNLIPQLRTLILSGYSEADYVEHALRMGARGYILKEDTTAILEGIRSVLRGEVYVSRSIRPPVLDKDSTCL